LNHESARRTGSLPRSIALSIVSLLVFLILAEALASLLESGERALPPGVQDAMTGFRLRSDNTYTEVGGAEVTTNSRGFRDEEVPDPRPPGGLRIIALGDSSTFGYGVRREEAYPQRLERALAKRFPGRVVEVLNAGTPGWSSGNGVAFLVSEGLSWKPDVVLVSFGYNEQLGSDPGSPHYDYDPRTGHLFFHTLGDALRSRPSPTPPDDEMQTRSPDRFEDFPRNTRFYLMMQRGIHGLRQGGARLFGATKSSRLASFFLKMLYRRDPELVYGPLRVEVRRNHVLEAFVSHLEEMVRRSRDAGAAIVFVLQPRRAHRELLDLLPGEDREAHRRAGGLIEAGRAVEAIALLAPLHDARPQDAITSYILAIALQLEGRNTLALARLEEVLPLRSFTLNALMQQVAIRLDVPVVSTPLSFTESDRRDLFFPDRYHTRSEGYALVAEDVEKALILEGLPGVVGLGVEKDPER